MSDAGQFAITRHLRKSRLPAVSIGRGSLCKCVLIPWKSDMKTRWAVFSFSLLVVGSTLLALSISCAVLASESPLTHNDYLRMCHARDALWWTSTLIAFAVAWLFFDRIGTAKTAQLKASRALLSLLGSLLSLYVLGLLLFATAGQTWYRIARHFYP